MDDREWLDTRLALSSVVYRLWSIVYGLSSMVYRLWSIVYGHSPTLY
jgi:hypothetical protein